jgi:hypothetical protein
MRVGSHWRESSYFLLVALHLALLRFWLQSMAIQERQRSGMFLPRLQLSLANF